MDESHPPVGVRMLQPKVITGDQSGPVRPPPGAAPGRASARRPRGHPGVRQAAADSRARSSAPTQHRTSASTRRGTRRPDPVLAEAFGRHGARRRAAASPRRCWCVGRRAEQGRSGRDVADPWRDPSAIPSLGTPAARQGAAAGSLPRSSKLGVRDVLFGRRVSWRALTVADRRRGGDGAHRGRGRPLLPPQVVAAVTTVQGRPQETDGQRRNRPPTGSPKSLPTVSKSLVSDRGAQARTAAFGGSGVVIDDRGYIVTNNHVVYAFANDPAKLQDLGHLQRRHRGARQSGRP